MLCLVHITYMFDYKSFKHITFNQLYQGLSFPPSNYLHARKHPQGPHPFWALLAKRFLQHHSNSSSENSLVQRKISHSISFPRLCITYKRLCFFVVVIKDRIILIRYERAPLLKTEMIYLMVPGISN